MVNEFYGFRKDPFALQPDLQFLYLARSHHAALSAMMTGVRERKGVIVVTGEAGAGKTLLLHALLRDLSPKIRTAFIFSPDSDFAGLMGKVLRELGLSSPGQPGKPDDPGLLFTQYLKERRSRDETVVVVVDEAQNLDEKALEEWERRFFGDSLAAGVLQLVLVGHPDLERKWETRKLQPFRKRIAVRCRLQVLDRKEGRGYLRYRLKRAGRDLSEVFTSEAVNLVWEFAGGIPRVMNILCARALALGAAQSSRVIGSQTVREAIAGLDYLRAGRGKSGPSGIFRGIFSARSLRILFFILSFALFLFSLAATASFLFRR